MKYKIGDKVRVKSLKWYNENKNKYGTVKCSEVYFQPTMSKLCGNVLTIKNIDKTTNAYIVKENNYYWVDDMFESLVEEKTTQLLIHGIIFPNKKYADKVELCLGDDYEIVVEDGRTFVQRKKPKYPTTYEDCCRVLNVWYKDDVAYIAGYQNKLLSNFQKLLICRDAYWKIAGEEMGLGKPWEPDWEKSDSGYVYCIVNKCNNIGLTCEWIRNNYILSFPTAEMRDAFYENFKDLIEDCKELL